MTEETSKKSVLRSNATGCVWNVCVIYFQPAICEWIQCEMKPVLRWWQKFAWHSTEVISGTVHLEISSSTPGPLELLPLLPSTWAAGVLADVASSGLHVHSLSNASCNLRKESLPSLVEAACSSQTVTSDPELSPRDWVALCSSGNGIVNTGQDEGLELNSLETDFIWTQTLFCWRVVLACIVSPKAFYSFVALHSGLNLHKCREMWVELWLTLTRVRQGGEFCQVSHTLQFSLWLLFCSNAHVRAHWLESNVKLKSYHNHLSTDFSSLCRSFTSLISGSLHLCGHKALC